ncbi:MAG: PKD domain-containing protein [Haloarcula sp.]
MTESTPGEKLRALVLAALMVFSAVVVTISFGGSAIAASNTAGNVGLTITAGNDQATVTVDDTDLNTAGNTAETHIVNIESTSETQPTAQAQTGSDTGDGNTQTVSVSPSFAVADRNNDGSITKADFTLSGASDEQIKSVSGPSGGAYSVEIEDTSGSTSDGNVETVTYTQLTTKSTGQDTQSGSSAQITTSKPVADRTGDGAITSADFKDVVTSDDESITNVKVNNDRTVTLTITDSNGDGDTGAEQFAYLSSEWVQLTETGQDTGKFTGSISTTTSSNLNGVLKVSDGDTITATYWEDGTTEKTAQGTYSTPSLSASASASPSSVATGESISLDGTSSTGSGLSYQWDTDGDQATIEKTGSTASVSYSSSGVKRITLIVNDGQNSKTDTVKVAVGDSGAPTAKLDVYPRTVTKDETAYLVAQESTDDLQQGTKKYEFDIGADGSYEKSTTKKPFTKHTFSSTGDHDVKVRVTDYAGNTDTFTKTVSVKGKASVSSTSVIHTGNGTEPSGTINVKTRNEGGMLKLHLYRGSSAANRDLAAAGVAESTELWVNVTMQNYEADMMMGGASVDEWLTKDVGGGKTKLAIKMHPINMQRLSNPGSKSPGRWPSQNKQADSSITPGAHLATFDVPDGTQFETDMSGATLTSDAQQFSPPRYNKQTNQLTYTVAAPHWKASGKKVSSNTNTGFYEAWIPSGMVSKMGINNPDELGGTYKSGGQSNSLSNMEVTKTSTGGLHINVTGIHYSSGTVQLSPDTTAPTADAGSDQSVTAGSSMSFDGSASSDNRKITKYEWDVDDDGKYELTGKKPSHTYSSTGSKTVTLRVTDGNGNTATDTVKVDVSSSSTSSGGGGDSDSGGGTSVTNSTETQTETTVTKTNVTTNVEVSNAGNASVTVDVSAKSKKGNVSVDQMSVSTSDTEGYTLNVSSHDQNPGTTPSPTETEVGSDPVGYVQVDHSVPDERIGNVTFNFAVSTQTLEERGLDPDEVSLYRYHDGSWQQLSTTHLETADGNATFEAVSPGLSTFAVGATERADISVTSAVLDTEEISVGETATLPVTVENTGGAEGSTPVELTAGGDVVTTETVTVAPGETTTVMLSATFESAGEYDLAVAGTDAGTLSVIAEQTATPASTPMTETEDATTAESGPGFGVGVALAALAAAALLARRRQ